ncbi:ABC transporter substrate-binding protein [Saliterribacillus persicus]|uniref:Amino acid/amide ABC transporter substrate-binding protein (HAAT family) n=1 Tax=Saliterribacillus persicus TaxID=930114 RepID=A0A368X499_9BACI|nr:ABC transporter substrate-binding protein [Saliterribacillus persicus]RCW62753.1 amino acid/amide ABC transporter substrate-binding protein (HAAT family) [Saliterribacillus persicus]
MVINKYFYVLAFIFVCSLGLVAFLLTDGEKSKESTLPKTTGSGEINIGAILPLSGELSSKAEMIKLALNISMENANNDLGERGSNLKFNLTVEDSKSEPKEALKKAKELYQQGISIFIAGSSAEIQALKPWADEKDIVIISYSSTAPSLDDIGDSIFRMVPNDNHQSNALATLMVEEDIEYVIPVHRNDIYGRELVKLFKEDFNLLSLNGKVTEAIEYNGDSGDFESVIEQIQEKVSLSEVDNQKTAVMLVAFGEAAEIFKQASSSENIRWFGTETLTLNNSLLESEEVLSFAKAVKFMGLSFGVPSTEQHEEIEKNLEEQYGSSIMPTALYAYDIAGLLMTVLQKMDAPGNVDELKKNLVKFAETYEGATGLIVLDEAGDRRLSSYDIWQVKEESNNYWFKIGTYRRELGIPGYITEEE